MHVIYVIYDKDIALLPVTFQLIKLHFMCAVIAIHSNQLTASIINRE